MEEIRKTFSDAEMKAWKALIADKENNIVISPERLKTLLKIAYPNRYALYEAGWRAGYVVNGLPANG